MKVHTAILLMVIILVSVSGCGTSGGKKVNAGVSKSFYGRTIVYNIEPEAKEYLSKLELLIARSYKIDPPIPDETAVPLYRDADMDRDHFITAMEAQVYYQDFILKFEDSLGSVKFRSIATNQ